MPRIPSNDFPSNEEESIEEEEDDEEQQLTPTEEENEEQEDEEESEPSPTDRPNAAAAAAPTSDALKPTATPTKSSKRVAAKDQVNKSDHPNKRLIVESTDADPNEDDDDRTDKKSSFQRLWSLDDEFVVLKGLIDFKKKNEGLDPNSDINAFLDSIQGSLHVQVSTQQLKRKIRGLKDKYKNNAKKARKSGRVPNFPKSHDFELFKLSKKIWDESGHDEEHGDTIAHAADNVITMVSPEKSITEQMDGNSTALIQPKALFSPEVRPNPKIKEVHQMTLSHYPYLSESLQSCKNWTMVLPGLGERLTMEGFALVQKSKAEELEHRFRMQQIEETEIYLNRVALIREQTELILDALKSSMS